jgi:hypothetical protein
VVTVLEPPDVEPEVVELLLGELVPVEPEADPWDGPHPVRIRPAAAASRAIALAGRRRSCA